jgi:uncharacterized membrane protein YqhA
MGNESTNDDTKAKWIENAFEKFLWNARLVILLGVFGLLASSAVIFAMGILETISLTLIFFNNIFEHGIHFDEKVYNTIIVQIITTVDDFLLGIVLLIFGLGTYDLFISRIDHAHSQDDLRPDWLIFNSLDELKSVLGKVVLMILTINFLKIVVNMEFEEPLDLLYLGGGIGLVSLALKLSHGKDLAESTAANRLKTDREFREIAKEILGQGDKK